MRCTRRLGLLFLLGACLLASCSRAPAYLYREPDSIGDGWEVGGLTDVGIEPTPIAEMMDAIRGGGFDSVTSILIVRNGQLVFEAYLHGYSRYRQHYVASVTKSITSLLIGIAIDEGRIAGADQRVAELLPQYADLMADDPAKAYLRLSHLLSMTAGFDWDEETVPYGTAGNDCYEMAESLDAPAYVLSRPIVDDPGTRFEYCGGNPALHSAIIQTATGRRVDAYADEVLFGPLGIATYDWRTYRDGHSDTSGGLSLRPRDMAKVGQLMLAGGMWDGQRIVSEAWVRESTRVHARVSAFTQYGYQWWRERQPLGLHSEEAYFAAGFGGQMIIVLPGLDAVVVITNDTGDEAAGAAAVQVLMREYTVPAMVGTTASDVFIWAWYVLTGAALLATVTLWARDGTPRADRLVPWVLIVCLLGPVGLAILLSWRRWGRPRALGAAACTALGSAVALVALTLAHRVLVRSARWGSSHLPSSFFPCSRPASWRVGCCSERRRSLDDSAFDMDER